jgi:acyl-CoA thioester hydrolase
MTVFDWPISVYYEDTDAGGVVYYANYLKFLERARTEWLRSFGFQQHHISQTMNVVFAVRSVQIDYKKPAHLDDQLSVSVEVIDKRKASLHLHQNITNNNGELIVNAAVNIVCLHSEHFTPCPIPKSIYEALNNAC